MSKISTLHDAIVNKVSTNLTSYTQIPNPYDIPSNPKSLLTRGFGVSIGTGIRTDRVVGCQVSWERSFLITLVNYVNTTDTKISIRESITKGLLEDHYTLLSQFEIDAGLSGTAIDVIVNADGGVELIEFDSKPHFLMEIEIVCEYVEDLTSL